MGKHVGKERPCQVGGFSGSHTWLEWLCILQIHGMQTWMEEEIFKCLVEFLTTLTKQLQKTGRHFLFFIRNVLWDGPGADWPNFFISAAATTARKKVSILWWWGRFCGTFSLFLSPHPPLQYDWQARSCSTLRHFLCLSLLSPCHQT